MCYGSHRKLIQHQFSSVTQSHFVAPWTAVCQVFLSIANSRACSNWCPSSQWCHPTISSSVIPFFFCLQSFAIAFLPRSKHLLISWLQSPSAVILEPKKIKSVTVSIASSSIYHELMRPDAMIFFFWMLNFNPAFSLSFFTFINRLFSSSSLSAIRVVSSAYLRLLIFLPAILIPFVLHPAQRFSWCTLHRS